MKGFESYLVHGGKDGCGEIVMYFQKTPQAGDPINAETTAWADGTECEAGENIRCPSCNGSVCLSEQYISKIGGRHEI